MRSNLALGHHEIGLDVEVRVKSFVDDLASGRCKASKLRMSIGDMTHDHQVETNPANMVWLQVLLLLHSVI